MDAEVQYIAITFDDGTVAIMQFVLAPRLPEGTRLIGYDPITGRREATDEAVADEIARSAWLATPLTWRRMVKEEIPEDRTFRNAWHDLEGRVRVDMVKARVIQRERLREARTLMLIDLDVEYQRADEVDDVDRKKAIAARKQQLRDVTKHPQIESAKTPDELKIAGLDVLRG